MAPDLAVAEMKCAVLGSPISHSLSPAMHRAAYAALGLAGSYGSFDVGEGELAHFLAEHANWRGFSVTAPLKREAAELAVQRDQIVQTLSVANTLVATEEGWSAYNTDVPGAANALRQVHEQSLRTVRILGAGATAASLSLAAKQLGAESVELRVRDLARTKETAAAIERLGLDVSLVELSVPVTESTELLISTIPSAALAGREHEFSSSAAVVFDAIYHPWPTPLMRSTQADGRPLVTGLDLLAHQAVLQVALLTGMPVDPQILHDAAIEALSNR